MFECFRSKKQHEMPKLPNPTSDELAEERDIIENQHKQYPFRRIALIVGHTDESSGASTYRTQNGKKYREYDWNKERAHEIKELIDLYSDGVACKVFLRDDIGIDGACKEAGKWGADCVLELHFNSVGYKPASGGEILMLKGVASESEVKKARMLINAVTKHLSTKKRHDDGIKWLEKGDRGYYNLYYSHKYNKNAKLHGLIEPEFAGYPTDQARKLFESDGPKNYSKVIAQFLLGKEIKQ